MIYVHVPFCRSFCTYCDFYSETACRSKEDRMFREWMTSLRKEIASRREEIERSSEVNTLYIGGGTPSLLPPSYISSITEALGKKNFEEFTVEVNPDDIFRKGKGYVQELMQIGVNRISMGVQSLDDGILKWMNRRHDASEARKAMRILRDCGCGNVSLDLIFGISLLSDTVLESTLDEMLEYRPQHLSAYQLSIEDGSTLAAMVEKGLYTEADEEFCRKQYELICSKMADAGYHHYEISNWALPGMEAVHNYAYWNRSPYVGLGPGAHSLSIGSDGTQRRSWNSTALKDWTSEYETLTPEEIREEELMLGLRTDKGTHGITIPEKDWFVSEKIISDLV